MTAAGVYAADADQWLSVHEDQIVGVEAADAVEIVRHAGLVPYVAMLRGALPDPGVPDPGRIRLIVGGDGRVCRAKWG